MIIFAMVISDVIAKDSDSRKAQMIAVLAINYF